MDVQSHGGSSGMAGKGFRASLFVVGIILSPATWWNDAFVNIPLSYLIAHPLYRLTGLPFHWLVIVCYWFTNVIGVALVYVSGRKMVTLSSRPVRSAIWIVTLILIYTFLMLYVDHLGWMRPIGDIADRIADPPIN